MSELKTRVAYIQGLSAGLDLDSGSKEGKILSSIIELLDEFADSVGDLEKAQEHLEDYMESLDEDLFQLEGEIYEDDEGDFDDDHIEVDCPKCGEIVCFDSDILEDEDVVEVTCPNCDEVVFINDDSGLTDIQHQAISGSNIDSGRMSSTEEDI